MGKAFRDGETGSRHNPEFTLLEWYRPGFDHHDLMDEMDDFLNEMLGARPAERSSYAELFQYHAGIDPHDSSTGELRRLARALGLKELENLETDDRDDWLNLILTHFIEPKLGRTRPSFIYDYPVSQSALARVRSGDPPVAERFEVYVRGVELANGFHELTDSEEQRRRFEADLFRRQTTGKEQVPIDEYLLSALASGMPWSAGVALGVDRLIMLAAGIDRLSDVIAFPIDRA
jgi:lysyl-tRNA synthetase class 2